jgi:UDP-N-acetylenolpyruvoylglucosamine reductase
MDNKNQIRQLEYGNNIGCYTTKALECIERAIGKVQRCDKKTGDISEVPFQRLLFAYRNASCTVTVQKGHPNVVEFNFDGFVYRAFVIFQNQLLMDKIKPIFEFESVQRQTETNRL